MNTILHKILNKNYDFCCLCFNAIENEPIHLQDEIILLDCFGHNVNMTEIMSYVLGDDVISYISAFDTLCKQCSTSAINSYRFIKESKFNSQHLCDMLDHLSSSFQDTPEDLVDSKSMFVCIPLKDQYYDSADLKSNRLEAFQRFLQITKDKRPKIEVTISPKSIKMEKTTKKCKTKDGDLYYSKIKTVDMLFDKDDPTNLKCKECLKVYTSVGNLRSHYIRVHALKQYKCPECPKQYSCLALVHAHKQECHVTRVCSECGKTFNNRHTLKMHEKNHYLKLVCQTCGRVYSNHNTFKKHIDNNICQMDRRRSHADAQYTCDYCQKKYTQKMTLRVHIQYEHLNYKYLECKWCKKRFWCKSRLNAHIVKHTKERNFNCTICNGKFVTRESLLYHTRIHTGERPYACMHCNSRFLSASRRAAHIKSQHMDPTVECEICHSKFKSYYYLQKHKKIHSEERNTDLENTPNAENIAIETLHDKSLTEHEPETNLALHTELEPKINTKPENLPIHNIPRNKQLIEIHSDNGSKIEFAYEIPNVNSQQQSNSHDKVYMEVPENVFVVKVSENIEV